MSGKGVNTADFLLVGKGYTKAERSVWRLFFFDIIQRAFWFSGCNILLLSTLRMSAWSCIVFRGIEYPDYHLCAAQIGAQPHLLARQHRNVKGV